MEIDVALNFSLDAKGKDPDSHSPILKSYHKFLWSKPLPNGKIFALTDSPGKYLCYPNSAQKMELGSDSIANSYAASGKLEIKKIIAQVDPALVESFRALNNTIGAFIVFPSTRISGQMNLNGARGFNSLIADRFDLTLECIRRHYAGIDSPLKSVLNRYIEFFELFEDFNGYVDFFFLGDLVNRTGKIKFFLPQKPPFSESGYPSSETEYLEYRENSMAWTFTRNETISKWVISQT